MIGVLRSALGENAAARGRDSSLPRFGAGLAGGNGSSSLPVNTLLGKSVGMEAISSCRHSSPHSHEGDGNHNGNGDGNGCEKGYSSGGHGAYPGDIASTAVGNMNGRSGHGGGPGSSTLTTKRTSSFDRLERLVMNKTPPVSEDGISVADEARSGRSGSVAGSGSSIYTAAAPGLTTASTKAW